MAPVVHSHSGGRLRVRCRVVQLITYSGGLLVDPGAQTSAARRRAERRPHQQSARSSGTASRLLVFQRHTSIQQASDQLQDSALASSVPPSQTLGVAPLALGRSTDPRGRVHPTKARPAHNGTTEHD